MGRLGWVSQLAGPFETTKIVRFRSVRLALVSKAATFVIVLYVVGYNVLLQNRHFVKSQPNGIGRLQLQRPTKDHCNPNKADCQADFTPLKDLPYCRVYEGDRTSVGKKLPCQYFDEKMMNPNGKTDSTLLIPTRTTVTTQKRTGLCFPDDTKQCTNVYAFNNTAEKTVYVADIERFTLLIDHAFMVPFEDRKLGAPVAGGASTLYQGFFEVCKHPFNRTECTEVKIPCFSGCGVKDNHFVPDEATSRRLRGQEALDDRNLAQKDHDDASDAEEYKPNFFSIKVGDVIPIYDLLDLAGLHLNEDVNEYRQSLRYEGSVLQIDIDYVNIGPFQWPPWAPGPIRYVYRVSMLPMNTFKEVSETFAEHNQVRLLHDWHGIFVRVSLTGSISYVSIPQFILVMTTSIGLLAAAELIVHMFALYLLGKEYNEEYTRVKYDNSCDFDKQSIFENESPEGTPKSWEHYAGETEESLQAFINDFKSNDGETFAMAAHIIWELYHRSPDKKGLRHSVSNRNLQNRLSSSSTDLSNLSLPPTTSSHNYTSVRALT